MFSRWIYMVFAASTTIGLRSGLSGREMDDSKQTSVEENEQKMKWNFLQTSSIVSDLCAHFSCFLLFFRKFYCLSLVFLRTRWISSVCCWMSPSLLWVTCKHEMSLVCRTHSRSPASEFVALKSNVGHLRVCRISLRGLNQVILRARKNSAKKTTQHSHRVSAWKKENFHFYSSINEKKSWRWNEKCIIWWGERAWKWKKSEISRRK